MNKKALHFSLRLAVYLLFATAFIYIIMNHGHDIQNALSKIEYKWLLVLVPLQFAMIAISGFAFKILSLPFQFKLKWQDWMGLSFIANFINQLLPYRPGFAFRYLYLKQNYNMPLNTYLWIMAAYLAITCFIAACFCLLGWLFGKLYIIDGRQILCILILCGGLLLFGYFLKKSSHVQTTSRFDALFTALKKMMHEPGTLSISSISFIISYLIITLLFYSIFISLHHPIAFTHCMFLTGIITVASIVPITAANIGVNESLMGVLTQLLYQDFSLGFSATLIYRMSQWVPAFIFGTLFSFYLVGNIFPWRTKHMQDITKP
ncbi:flippase-like domain-containing protein [Candidatus Berkiella cookevillensis]|uniref:Flippase-like domain-containing protein n=1 Tax=Candidatus Berkiella cookevillensis TaxID=437022 RepID=A0A0Q9YE58_9GAMM|nr:lysylphosphatidylglycerol synthase transmembrane domain-containing protein [Candidatus Berkiella cookevillensis]MCS5709182.1 flippase-like domain-containing protein [Candidatus Berkiella cookevillensis]